MSIDFHCNQCQSLLRLDANDRGKKTRCPRCGMIQQAPAWSTNEPITDVPDDVPAIQIPAAEQETEYRQVDSSGNSTGQAEPAQTAPVATGNATWSMKTPDGQVYGPVSRRELEEWAGEGRVSSQCLLQMQGHSHWQSALNLFPSLGRMRITETSHTPAIERTRRRRHRVRVRNDAFLRKNNGIPICLLAIAGLFVPFFPILSIIALIWGVKERKAIDRGMASGENRTPLDIGFVIGIIGTVIGVVGLPTCSALLLG